MFSIESLIFLLSSLVSLALIYYKVSSSILQQIILVLLIILIIFFSRFFFSKSKTTLIKQINSILLFLTALTIQLVVISTGGFFSPFLIILHLYTLGASFLFNLSALLTFLILSVGLLGANTLLNQNLKVLFEEDPFSTILYIISFIVIIPLAQYLMKTYHLKDALSNLLTQHLEIGQLREKSIVEGLSEMVVVTDVNLNL